MNEVMTLSKYATAKEICELCNISKTSVHTLSKLGKFPKPIKFGRAVRWNMEHVKAWLEQQEKGE